MLEVPTVPKAGVPKDSRKGAGGKIRCVGWDHIPGWYYLNQDDLGGPVAHTLPLYHSGQDFQPWMGNDIPWLKGNTKKRFFVCFGDLDNN